MPRVIIGSPLFNHAGDFPEAIESILNQTFTDFALVLVDDCSTDETAAIAQEYAALWAQLSETEREVRALGRKVSAHRVDVADRARMMAFASEVALAHGRVNLLVNNAGVGVGKSFEQHSFDDWEWIFGINLWGVIHGVKFCWWQVISWLSFGIFLQFLLMIH